MRATVAVLVVSGLVAAVSASVLLASWRVNDLNIPSPEPIHREVDIVVAAMDLPASTIVDSNALRVKRIAEREAPSGYVTMESTLGRVLLAPVVEGQVLKKESFARDSSGFRLAAVLPSGKRAMSIALNESAALEGMLHPGSHVDVIASFTAEHPDEESQGLVREMLSTVLLEGVQVLAVQDRTIVSDHLDDSSTQSGTRRRMVTLMVDSKQAEALQLAAAHGNISLAMRNPLDESGMDLRGTLFSDLAKVYADRFEFPRPLAPARAMHVASAEGVASPSPAEAPADSFEPVVEQTPPSRVLAPPPVWKTTITRGMERETVEFELEEEPARATAGRRTLPGSVRLSLPEPVEQATQARRTDGGTD